MNRTELADVPGMIRFRANYDCMEEIERPTEWLRALMEGRRPYRSLLEDCGSLAIAAYRLARARCRIQPVASLVPTAAELCVAAAQLVEATGSEYPIPPVVVLVDECEQCGLPVIAPVTRAASALAAS
jgi:hypothetical protein